MAKQRVRSIHQNFQYFRATRLAVACAAALSPMAVFADPQAAGSATTTTQANAQSGQLNEIIVTAQKREQRAIDTPLSVTALDANALADHQVAALADLEFVSPGVRAGEQQGINRLFIRGIGLTSFASGADPSSGFYVDGVYIGRPTEQLSSMYDVQRVEVVRGPQGTLYGRNATGGAVNVITNDPTAEDSGYLDVSFGNYDLHRTQGALSGALNSSGTLLGRVAFDFLNHNGYGEDEAQHHPINDANKQNFRGTLEYKPNDKVDLKLIAEFTHEADNDYYTMAFGADPLGGQVLAGTQGAANPANGAVPAGIAVIGSQNGATALPDITNRRTGEALTAVLSIDLDEAMRFTSITGFRHFQRYNATDSDNTSAGLGNTLYTEWNRQLSQEFQLNYHNSKWDSVGGLYFYYENIKNFVLVPFPQFTNVFGPGKVNYVQHGEMPIAAFAAFAQTTYSIEPDLRVTLGGRFSAEERHSIGFFTGIPPAIQPIDQEKTWRSFTPKAGVEYNINPDTLWYASATNGFKSGTFNVGQINPAIDPEKIWAYETGLKSEFFDHRIEASGALFYYDYKNLQVNKVIGIATETVNAASAKNKGIELEGRAKVTEQFTVDANFTYLKATFSSFDSINPITGHDDVLDGNMLPGAPKIAAGLGAAYKFPLASGASITARADGEYTSRIYFSEFNDLPTSQDPVTKVNASLKYVSANDKWTATLWGKNVTDRFIAANKLVTIALWGYPIYGSVEPPATYGITLGYKF
jgi:iron complex outermembrane receptor protein